MATSNYTNLESRGYLPISATSSTAVSISTFISAASAASAKLSYPNFLTLRPETQAIRWRDDGTAPTAAVSGGNPLAAGESMDFDGEVARLQVIAQAGTATVNVNLYNAF